MMYPYDKWEIIKLKLLSIFSKKAREDLKYIELDMYYWFKWQRKKYEYYRLYDLVSIAKGFRDCEISYNYVTFGDFTNE